MSSFLLLLADGRLTNEPLTARIAPWMRWRRLGNFRQKMWDLYLILYWRGTSGILSKWLPSPQPFFSSSSCWCRALDDPEGCCTHAPSLTQSLMDAPDGALQNRPQVLDKLPCSELKFDRLLLLFSFCSITDAHAYWWHAVSLQWFRTTAVLISHCDLVYRHITSKYSVFCSMPQQWVTH